MGKVIFRFGPMEAAKSASTVMTAFNFEEHGFNVLVLKSSLDTRWGVNKITSRAGGMSRECTNISPSESIVNLIKDKGYDVVIVDECQFLSPSQVEDLARIADEEDLTVICFGLKNTAIKGELFEGSKALLYWADAIEELKTVCTCCEHKATQNLRMKNGIPIYDGDKIVLGDTKAKADVEYYLPVCRKHYFAPDMERITVKMNKKLGR